MIENEKEREREKHRGPFQQLILVFTRVSKLTEEIPVLITSYQIDDPASDGKGPLNIHDHWPLSRCQGDRYVW